MCIRDSFGSGTGDYELTANIIEDDFSADVNTTGVLATDGTIATGTIEIAGDADWFAIDLVAGETYSIILTSDTIIPPDLFLNLRDSVGDVIASGVDLNGMNNILTFTASEAGTFFVDVGVSDFAFNTGDYELIALQDDFSADVNTTGVLETDGTVTTGTIEIAGDADWFAIDLVAGGVYSIVLSSDTIFPFDIFLNLRDSSGGLVTSGSFDGINNTLDFTASETGTFFVDVGVSDFAFNTGEYNLTANIIEDDFNADVNTTGVLTADGAVTTGAIDFAGDSDWFAIDVVAGEQYIIDLTGVSISQFDIELGLYSSSGNFVSGATSSDQLIFTAAETGTVFIEAAGLEFTNSTGEYNLTATQFTPPQDDFTADITTTGVLTSDGIVTTGTIDFADDVDWFALEVTQGESYTVQFTSTDLSPFNADVELYDSAGNFLLDGSDVLTFTAQSTGTVFIHTDVFGSGTGDYLSLIHI